MLDRVGGDVADRAVELACRPDVIPRDLDAEFRKSLEQSARGYAFEERGCTLHRIYHAHKINEVKPPPPRLEHEVPKRHLCAAPHSVELASWGTRRHKM